MPDLSHVMPNPRVVPILWGHDYVVNPATTTSIEQMISDLVTMPFMNGMAQYGVIPGTQRADHIRARHVPPSRQQIEASVMEFGATDAHHPTLIS